MENEKLTIAEAARRCGCPRSTLQRAIRAGRLHLDADHRLAAGELTRAGYLSAPGALLEHTADAQQSRYTLVDMLRDMQRTMERCTEVMEALTQELRHMQQSCSSRTPRPPARTRQQRSMERTRPVAATTARAADADAAFARMQALQAQGLTLAQIAAQLTAEGLRTRHGKAWHKSSVAYVLKTHGR